jgi:ABC-type Fe3+ transport system permease subunit
MAQGIAWRSLLNNDGAFVGLANYARYFRTPAIAASITNSLYVSAASMVITVALAFGYAYGLTRTLMPWRGLFRIVAMLPLLAPSLVQALAFIYAFGNNGIPHAAHRRRRGHLPRQGRHRGRGLLLLPPRAPDPRGRPLRHRRAALAILIISNLIHYLTVGFLTATTALKQMDGEFENVSASLGVPFYRTFARVTVPIALPAIIAISMYHQRHPVFRRSEQLDH